MQQSVARLELVQNMSGPSADLLLNNDFDIGVLRPYIGDDGRSYVTRTINGKQKVFLSNAPATLPRDAWIEFDREIQQSLNERLRIVADIRGKGLEYKLPNGMGHTLLQYQTLGDITPATLSMDPSRRSEGDRPETDQGFLPLPIAHKDFDISAREIEVSKRTGMPLDTTTARLAARKVGELLEDLTIGNGPLFKYAGAYLYGLLTLPQRALKADMPVPTGSNGNDIINALLALRQMLLDDNHPGPYNLYFNKQWAQYLDQDFSTTKGDNTLRQRILAISDFRSVEILDRLPSTNWHVLMLEMTSENVRMVIGFEAQTVQWESVGGMMKHYKVMAMINPQVRPDADGNSGVGHGRAA